MGKIREEDQNHYEYLIHKVRKLEKKMRDRHRRRRRHVSSSSESGSNSPNTHMEADGTPIEMDTSTTEKELNVTSPITPAPFTSIAPPPFSPPTLPLPPAEQEIDEIPPPNTELDSFILEILGEDPSIVRQYGKEIQNDLAVRLQHTATSGLSKETRKELNERYLPPNNCTLVDAPELNPEIKAAVSESVIKRDKGIELKQKQLGRAITCLGEALTILLSNEDKDTPMIKLLMDACRLLCDIQNMDSVTRRNFVLFNLKKDMKDQVQKTKIDKLLFGTDLAETLKTAKIISKSGADLKPIAPSNRQTTSKNKTTPHQASSAPPKRNNLNWKAPLNRRPQGTQRNKEPAPRNQHANNSRTSYRAPQHRYNNNNSRR